MALFVPRSAVFTEMKEAEKQYDEGYPQLLQTIKGEKHFKTKAEEKKYLRYI